MTNQIYHHQRQMHNVVDAVMKFNTEDKEFQQYQSIVGMFYTLLEEERMDELDFALKFHFPEYYSSPRPTMHPEFMV